MARFGSVVSVVERPVGTTLALAALTGDDFLVVDDVSKLSYPAGGVQIGPQKFLYTVDGAADQTIAVIDQDEEADGYDEMARINLSSALTADYAVDEPVIAVADVIVTERIATVQLPDQADTLELRVPRNLKDRLPTDIRANGETVELENRQGQWVISDVIAEDPSVDGSYIVLDTLPASQIEQATVGADLSLFFTDAWSNPGNLNSAGYATALGASGAPEDLPGNTGFKYAGAAVDTGIVGAQDWNFEVEATGPGDESGAQCDTDSGSLNSHYLELMDYGFAVPGGATITGVQVTVTRRNAALNEGSGVAIMDNIVKLVKGGVVVGSDRSNDVHWPGDFTGIAYGDGSDLWGTTLTPADVNASDFGVAISADIDNHAKARIDSVRIKVSYTTPAPASYSFTHFLLADHFTFAIPDDATITGVTVTVRRKADDDTGGDWAIDNQVKLYTGTDTSDDRAQRGIHWATADENVAYGGDLWGMDLTPDDVNASTFGVIISAKVADGVTASIDYVKATVAYVMQGDA